MSARRPTSPRSWTSPVLWWTLAVEAVVVVVVHRAVGLPVTYALLAFLVLAALSVVCLDVPEPRDPRWRREPVERRDGHRDEISSLSWAFMTRDETVSVRAVLAVREAAATRLALHGITLADDRDAAAARTLLGADAYEVLVSTGPPPTMAVLGRCIDRLAALVPAERPPGPPTRHVRAGPAPEAPTSPAAAVTRAPSAPPAPPAPSAPSARTT